MLNMLFFITLGIIYINWTLNMLQVHEKNQSYSHFIPQMPPNYGKSFQACTIIRLFQGWQDRSETNKFAFLFSKHSITTAKYLSFKYHVSYSFLWITVLTGNWKTPPNCLARKVMLHFVIIFLSNLFWLIYSINILYLTSVTWNGSLYLVKEIFECQNLIF